jgi:hypothetical protein
MDPMIVQSYQVGIGIGLILLSTLILFPGTTTSFGTTDPNTFEEIHHSRNQRSGDRNDPKNRSSDMKNRYRDEDDAIAAYWTPHRQLNMFVYTCIIVILCFVWIQSYQDHTPLIATTHITTGTTVPPLTTQQEESIQQQKYKQQLQHPTTLLKLFFQTYFPKEASVFFGGNRLAQRTDKQQEGRPVGTK